MRPRRMWPCVPDPGPCFPRVQLAQTIGYRCGASGRGVPGNPGKMGVMMPQGFAGGDFISVRGTRYIVYRWRTPR